LEAATGLVKVDQTGREEEAGASLGYLHRELEPEAAFVQALGSVIEDGLEPEAD
jgi:hypothetical protein